MISRSITGGARPARLGGEKVPAHDFQESEKLDWSDPWLQSIDLEYHNVTLDQGLYYELKREGQMRRLVSEEQIKQAIFQPPETTRAFFRGRAVAKFNREIESIQWDELTFRGNGTIALSSCRIRRTTRGWTK